MKHLLKDGTVLYVHFDYPPIPARDFDYSCVSENFNNDEEDIVGRGESVKDAIEDYLRQQEWQL